MVSGASTVLHEYCYRRLKSDMLNVIQVPFGSLFATYTGLQDRRYSHHQEGKHKTTFYPSIGCNISACPGIQFRSQGRLFWVERQELSKMMGATARWNKCQARTCSNIPLHSSMRTICCILRTFCWILRTICWILHTFWHKFAALAAKRLFGGTWEVGWVSVKGGACATPVAEDLWQPDWAWYEL